jgi:uncharacterized protein (DUF2384 family)
MAKATVTRNRRSKADRQSKPRTASKRATVGSNGGRPATGFSERKSIEELAAEQGIKPTRLEDILGKGADLWDSDREFEQFVEDIYARRREDRELARR